MIELIITSTNVYPPWHRPRTEVSTAIRRIGDETIVNRVPLPVVLLMSALQKCHLCTICTEQAGFVPDQGIGTDAGRSEACPHAQSLWLPVSCDYNLARLAAQRLLLNGGYVDDRTMKTSGTPLSI